MDERISLRQSNKGFTLVEICVTLVIFSILATIITMSLISWQAYSTNTEQEDKAELVYMAFRNKMAILKANNVIEAESTGTSEYYYCKKGDYQKYKSNNNTVLSNKNIKTLFDYVIPYIYDKKMLDAYIVVEIDGGDIKMVLYSDRYDCTSPSVINELKNNSDKRYDNVVGMYTPN